MELEVDHRNHSDRAGADYHMLLVLHDVCDEAQQESKCEDPDDGHRWTLPGISVTLHLRSEGCHTKVPSFAT